MVGYRDPQTRLPLPSCDLWEERRGIHAFTVAAVYAGLRAAAHFADAFGETDRAATLHAGGAEMLEGARAVSLERGERRFARMVHAQPRRRLTPRHDHRLEPLRARPVRHVLPPDDQQIASHHAGSRGRGWVKTDIGGVARYENDYYHQVSQDIANVPGNPWFICTCWLAEYHIAAAETLDELHAAPDWLEWAAHHALPRGVLAEQLNPYTGAPLSVSPLTWSHAEYVRRDPGVHRTTHTRERVRGLRAAARNRGT